MKKFSKKLLAAACTSALMVSAIGCSNTAGGGTDTGSAGGGCPDALLFCRPSRKYSLFQAAL